MITQRDRSALRTLMQSTAWKSVEQIAEQLSDKYKSDTVVRDTEWETLKTALLNEGIVRGIKTLLEEIMAQALMQKDE